MDPEQYRLFTGVMSFASFFSLIYLLHWQIRIWPDDRQKWAATAFVLCLVVLVGQLCISYLGGPAMGTTWRGAITFGLWTLSTVWLAISSRAHILDHMRRMDEVKRQGGITERPALLFPRDPGDHTH